MTLCCQPIALDLCIWPQYPWVVLVAILKGALGVERFLVKKLEYFEIVVYNSNNKLKVMSA
jgi:hypothetical protein